MPTRILAAALLALVLGACAHKNPGAPVVVRSAAPAPNSPVNVIRTFAWAVANHDTAAYMAVLTDDFRFQFAPNDSAGNPYRDQPWDRAIEGAAVGHMMVGGGTVAPASGILLTIDNVLVAQSDPRPGKNPRWHKSVRTHVDLRVTVDAGGSPNVNTVQGYALFYVVRGDSAALSPARAAVAGRDSTRWYIERWEDETAGTTAGMHANPTRSTTWGSIKALYVWGQDRPAP